MFIKKNLNVKLIRASKERKKPERKYARVYDAYGLAIIDYPLNSHGDYINLSGYIMKMQSIAPKKHIIIIRNGDDGYHSKYISVWNMRMDAS